MSEKLTWILLTLFAILILIFGFKYFHMSSSGSSDQKATISKMFSDSAYLDSLAGQVLSFENKNACKPVWDAAKTNGWNEGNVENYLDGGSSSSNYTKKDSAHTIHVFCKYDMSKGYYSSVRIEIK